MVSKNKCGPERRADPTGSLQVAAHCCATVCGDPESAPSVRTMKHNVIAIPKHRLLSLMVRNEENLTRFGLLFREIHVVRSMVVHRSTSYSSINKTQVNSEE
ncbi:unnamed protein product, partial [Ectocarpus sp. 12 AP-2014]